MADPITILTASAIANLAFQEFIKSGAGELAKKFTAEAIAKIDKLRQMIVEKLQGKSPRLDEALVKATQGDSAALETITKNLDVMMDDEPEFATELRVLIQEISAGEIRQIGLENFEAGELEAEIQQKTKTDSTTNIDQTGATGVKVQGKATIKVNQNIE
jgi:diketogulonate reductase-like aldo/keto reductase